MTLGLYIKTNRKCGISNALDDTEDHTLSKVSYSRSSNENDDIENEDSSGYEVY